jgi:1,4-alpha-glucan branching enzyme
VVNTDSAYYGGSNAGNAGGVHSEPVPCDGFADSAMVTLPPISTLFLKWTSE